MDLNGKTVIVTGSASGIGEAIARRIASLGAGVVVNSVSSEAAGQRIAAELGNAVYVRGDIADPATGGALAEAAIGRWGRIDGLVNNAAVTIDVPMPEIERLDSALWERVLRVNVIGTFLVAQSALPHLRDTGDGWIINISSVAGRRAIGSSLPYAVSKAAVDHMTALLARYVGPEVRVNAIAPGLIETPWTEVPVFDAIRERVSESAPLRRTGSPEDIADACVGIIGARYMTGQVIAVDGGTGWIA
jgi:ketoreductase RED2